MNGDSPRSEASTFWSRLPVAAQAAAALIGAIAALLVALSSFTGVFSKDDVAEPNNGNEGVTNAATEATVKGASNIVVMKQTDEEPVPEEAPPGQIEPQNALATTALPPVEAPAPPALPNETFPRRAVFQYPNMSEVDLMRSPGATSGALGTITREDRLFAGAEDGLWVHVATADGRTGYLRRAYITILD